MGNIRCFKDSAIPEDSKCAKCCLYCDEKELCEYKCNGIDLWRTELEIGDNCSYAYID